MITTIALSTNMTNASSSLTDGFGSSGGLVPIISIVIIVSVAIFVGSSVSRIEWFHDKLKTFSQSLYYTAIGVASTIVLGVFVAPIYYISQADGQTQKWALIGIAGVIVAYVVFTILGYVVDYLIVSNLREYMEAQE